MKRVFLSNANYTCFQEYYNEEARYAVSLPEQTSSANGVSENQSFKSFASPKPETESSIGRVAETVEPTVAIEADAVIENSTGKASC